MGHPETVHVIERERGRGRRERGRGRREREEGERERERERKRESERTKNYPDFIEGTGNWKLAYLVLKHILSVSQNQSGKVMTKDGLPRRRFI